MTIYLPSGREDSRLYPEGSGRRLIRDILVILATGGRLTLERFGA